MSKFRVVRKYDTFFAHPAYVLQRKCKFLWWEWWETIEVDSLGINQYKWVKAFEATKVDHLTPAMAKGWGSWEEETDENTE